MSEHNSLRWHIEAVKRDRRRLSPEERLRLAAELIDAAVNVWLERIVRERKCSRAEAVRILREILWGHG